MIFYLTLGLGMIYLVSAGLFWFGIFLGFLMFWIFINKEDKDESTNV